ncbi:MAG TPA: LysR family transcriptional regulator, partial [Gammaproteobacteria bacterium]|nr:LysR family transcriptional regulator [Gammaproteobacteria bacterium]
MELDNLKAFIQVAEQGSFSRAAEKLFITQSAVSKRVSSLESSLNTPLFDRIGHKIILTEAGRKLLPRARHILLEVEDSKRAVANLTDTVSGPLVIGTSHHIGLHRMPPVLRQFTREYPDVQLDIRFMDSEEACIGVIHGDLELGIATLPLSPDPGLDLTPVWHDPLAIMANHEHPLVGKKNVRTKDLARHNAILPATGTFTREVLEQTLKPMNIELNVGMSTNYLETIKMLVSVGLGWSVLPQSMLDRDICMIDVRELKMERTLGVVSHTQRTPSNAARALLKTLQHPEKVT